MLPDQSDGDDSHSNGDWDNPNVNSGRPEMHDAFRGVQTFHRAREPFLRREPGECQRRAADHPVGGVLPQCVPDESELFNHARL